LSFWDLRSHYRKHMESTRLWSKLCSRVREPCELELFRTGLSRRTISLRVSERKFATPITLGPRAVGWIEAEITDWIAQRIVQSRKAARWQRGCGAAKSKTWRDFRGRQRSMRANG